MWRVIVERREAVLLMDPKGMVDIAMSGGIDIELIIAFCKVITV